MAAHQRKHTGLENVHPNEHRYEELAKKKCQNDYNKPTADCLRRAQKVTRRSSKTEFDGVPLQRQAPVLIDVTNVVPKREWDYKASKVETKINIEPQDEGMELDTSPASPEKELKPLYSEYCVDNCEYMFSLESRHAPRWDYMSRQLEITTSMRSVLVDWLISVADEYKMNDETLHKAIAYLDRFLSKMSVARHKFQLVGTAAMLVAAKYEEIFPPSAKEMVHLTADTYTIRNMLQMEQMMLRVLNFELGSPTALNFLAEFCRKRELLPCDEENEMDSEMSLSVNPVEQQVRCLAQYLSELCLLQGGSYLRYPPSCIAAAALTLAEYTLDQSETLAQNNIACVDRSSLCTVSGYSLQQLSPVMARQNATFRDSPTSPHRSVVEKFSMPKYASVALLKPRELLFDDL